jgi:predicted Zn-dependent protease
MLTIENAAAIGWNFGSAAVSTTTSTISSVATFCLDCIPILPMNPVTKHREIHLIPEVVLNAVGASMYEKTKLDAIDDDDSRLIKEIGQQLAQVSDRPDFEFEFILIDQKSESGKLVVNAFCLPGGKIAITKALLDKLKEEQINNPNYDEINLNELSLKDKIAAVLGHEITHACANHGLLKMSFGIVVYIAGKIVNVMTQNYYLNQSKKPIEVKKEKHRIQTGEAQLRERLQRECQREQEAKKNAETVGWFAEKVFSFSALFCTQHHSQECEHQSDTVGMGYAKKAGYDPRASIWLQEMFVKMHGEGKVQDQPGFLGKVIRFFSITNDLLSSHPPSMARVQKCKETWEKTLKS